MDKPAGFEISSVDFAGDQREVSNSVSVPHDACREPFWSLPKGGNTANLGLCATLIDLNALKWLAFLFSFLFS
jgi:hypothetical protein